MTNRPRVAVIVETSVVYGRKLLAETDLPLRAIADLSGFEHVEYLSVVFKRLTGLSPGRYREAVRS